MNNFFYDLNKRLATLADKQDAAQLAESKQAETVAQSPLTQALNEGQAKRLPGLPITKKDVEKKFGGSAVKMAKAAKEAGFSDARIRQAMDDLYQGKNPNDIDEAGYSAKAGRAGKDIGKPGKNFAKIAKSAGAKYGSKAAGERVAGAVLNKLRHPKEDIADEGNEFTGNLAKAKAQHKDEFEVDGKKYKVVEADNPGLEEGFKEMDAWLASREKEKGTGKFDKKKISTGTVYTRKAEEEPESDEDDTPKKVGRKTVGAGKGKKLGAKHSGRSKLASKSAIAEEIPVTDRGEYDDEAGMAKDSLHTIVRSARELENALRSNENLPEWVQEKIGQIKGMMSSVTDYMLSTHERDAEQQVMPEVAPPGAKAERMVKHIKKSLSKDGKLSDKDKAIAYATTWKAKKAGKVEEEGAKPDFLDVDKDGNKKETFKKAVKDKKEKTVDETTTAGSVATAPAAAKSSKGMQFGQGVYEGFNNKVERMITEGMSVTVNMSAGEEGEPRKSINVVADGDDADKLAELLKMAGLEHKQEACPACGSADCGCEEELDENSPDWPTNTETLAAQPELRTYSGGLNGPKSTGQTTIPVIASQLRRQASMEEGVKLERTLSTLYKNYKAK